MRTTYCFLQGFCAVHGVLEAVAVRRKKVVLHDVLFFATVLHHFLMSVKKNEM